MASGYYAGDLQLDVNTLVLRAQREDLLNVSYAKVTLNIGNATSTVVEALEYTPQERQKTALSIGPIHNGGVSK